MKNQAGFLQLYGLNLEARFPTQPMELRGFHRHLKEMFFTSKPTSHLVAVLQKVQVETHLKSKELPSESDKYRSSKKTPERMLQLLESI